MAKSKTYEMLLKIAGKTDGSLKAACSAAEKNLTALGSAAQKTAKVATKALAGIAAAAVCISGASLTAYSDFQQAMDSTAVTARATEEEYALMEAAARQMGATTTKTATEAAEAMGYMALAGWDVEESMAGLEPMLRLSEATGMDLARASDLATDSMSALGLGVGDMTDYLNLAVQAQRVSNTTAESLLEAFIGCGGAAKTAGVDMGDLSTALGVLANNGTKGSEAGTALNSMLSRMTTNDAALKAFKKLGVAVFDSAGNFRGLETVLGDTSAALSTLSDAERLAYMKNIAGTNYFTEMSYLLDAVADGADGAASAWSTLETDIMDHSGVLLEVAQANTDNLAGATAIFQSAVAELQLQIGEQLAPYAKEGLEYLANNVLPAVSEGLGEIIPQVIEGAKWAWEHRDVILAIATGVATAVGAYKAYKLAITAYNAAMGIYKVVTAASATGTFTLAGAMTALNIPVLAVVAAIGLLVAGGILLYKNWDTVKAKAADLGQKIGEIWANISGAVQNAIDAIGARFPLLGAYLQGWWNSIQAAWTNVQAIFSNIIDFVDNVFAGNWSAAWQNVVNIFGNLFGGLVNLAKAPINGVISAINFALEKVNGISVTIPDWVPGLGGKTLGFNIPTIPQLAAGGIATAPTLAEIGEGGEPEAVLPLSKLSAMLQEGPGEAPLARLAKMLDDWIKSRKPDPRTPSQSRMEFADGPEPEGGQNPRGDSGSDFKFEFHYHGDASPERAKEAAKIGFAEFKRLYQQMKAEERRKNLRASTH